MRDIKTYNLQRIVLPDGDFCNQEELFYREKELRGELQGEMVRGCLCSFDTWMNVFAAEKWYKYCDIGQLYLRISGRGRCRLDIQGHTLSVVHGVMTENILSLPCDLGEGSSMLVPLPDISALEGISLGLFYEADGFRMQEAVWCTDREPARSHRMAVVCCTFKREQYVTKNIRKFQALLADWPELSEKLHMFVSDNGRTLPESLANEHVDIIPNVNAGGAGGFGRGLMAANDEGYTRCVFMDDDVEFCPESFLRMLALTEYFKDEYKDAFVNGAMMSLYDRKICSESITVRNGFWLKPYHDYLSVADLYGTLKCLNVSDDTYEETFVSSSWWLACFSLDLYMGEYPVPCFIRGDDCEWSWRRLGVHHVNLNGVCVWHTPFAFNTRRMIDHYFLPRNMFMVHSIYNPDFRNEWFVYMNGFFNHFMATFNYASAELQLSALRDVLKGWQTFEEEPGELMGRLKAICRKAEVKTCDSIEKLEEVRNIGSGGWSEGGKGIVVDWFPSESVFMGKEEVEVYNLVTRKCEIRRPDRLRKEWQSDEYDMLVLRIRQEFEALRENLKAGFKEHTGREFWDEYLHLSSKQDRVRAEDADIKSEVQIEEEMDLLDALDDAVLLLDAEKPVADQIQTAMCEAVRHQLVQVLEHYYAEQMQQQYIAAAEENLKKNVLCIYAKSLAETASGIEYLLANQKAENIQQWKQDDADFLRESLRFHSENGASKENEDFLRECLDKYAAMYSDFRNVIVIGER